MRLPFQDRPALKDKMRGLTPTWGLTVQIDCCEIIEIAAATGYHFIMLDAEHGQLGIAEVGRLIRACDAAGLPAMVRIPDLSPSFIQRVLDAGAEGVVVPRIATAAQAAQAVRAARFAPVGERGACATSRAAGHLAPDWPAFVDKADGQALVWALIEDATGVANARAIAATPGLDGALFGAFDMAQALGHSGQLGHASVTAAFEQVHQACVDAGIARIGVMAAEPGGIKGGVDRGVNAFLIAFDAQALHAGLALSVRTAEQSLP